MQPQVLLLEGLHQLFVFALFQHGSDLQVDHGFVEKVGAALDVPHELILDDLGAHVADKHMIEVPSIQQQVHALVVHHSEVLHEGNVLAAVGAALEHEAGIDSLSFLVVHAAFVPVAIDVQIRRVFGERVAGSLLLSFLEERALVVNLVEHVALLLKVLFRSAGVEILFDDLVAGGQCTEGEGLWVNLFKGEIV